jgi:hypothetical protein
VTSIISGYTGARFMRSQVAMDIGNQVHDIIKEINRGKTYSKAEWEPVPEPVKQSVRAYIRWQKATGYISKESEYMVFSVKHGYAGTVDDLGLIKGYAAICDWKSGFMDPTAVALQICAYYQAFLEMNPKRVLNDLRGVHLDKKTGNFAERIIGKSEIKELFEQFLQMKEQAIPDMRNELSIKEVNGMAMNPAQTKAVARVARDERSLVISEKQAAALDILRTSYPTAPEVEIKAAAIICATYDGDPLMGDIFLIPYKDKEGKVTWSRVCSIKFKRKLGQRVSPFTYLDDTPRMMSEAEGQKIYGKRWTFFSKGKIVAITKLRDLATGKTSQGIGAWPENAGVIGAIKGNTPENMAFIRSESQAIERLNITAVPQMDVIDERFVDTTTGEILESPEVAELTGPAADFQPDEYAPPMEATPANDDFGFCEEHQLPFTQMRAKAGQTFIAHRTEDGKLCYPPKEKSAEETMKPDYGICPQHGIANIALKKKSDPNWHEIGHIYDGNKLCLQEDQVKDAPEAGDFVEQDADFRSTDDTGGQGQATPGGGAQQIDEATGDRAAIISLAMQLFGPDWQPSLRNFLKQNYGIQSRNSIKEAQIPDIIKKLTAMVAAMK